MKSNSHNQLYSKAAANFFGGTILRYKLILKYLNPQPDERILDIGCNKGLMIKKIKRYSNNATGIDINSEAIKKAVTSNIIEMDGAQMSFPSNSFDKIYSAHTIEHVPDLNKFIKEIERVLRPGGRVLLVYPFELLRGSSTLFTSLFICKNFSAARKIHLHRLTPNKIKELVSGTSLYCLKNRFYFDPWPSFFTVLEKKKGV